MRRSRSLSRTKSVIHRLVGTSISAGKAHSISVAELKRNNVWARYCFHWRATLFRMKL
jgi:hypothetical protein